MKLSAWRIVQARYSGRAFSGEGARLYGGRWNSPGVPMVYTAQSRALAALELLVHLEAPLLLAGFLFFEVRFDERHVTALPVEQLPAVWRSDPVPVATQQLGDHWARSAASPVLRLPSVLIPEEFNYLLNPLHTAFNSLEVRDPVPFAFDSRLNRR